MPGTVLSAEDRAINHKKAPYPWNSHSHGGTQPKQISYRGMSDADKPSEERMSEGPSEWGSLGSLH